MDISGATGDKWAIMLAGINRHVKVVQEARTGWWRCMDTDTGLSFMASEQWFVDRLPEEDDIADV